MIFASGLSFPEGPVVLHDGSWLVVEMEAQPGRATQISLDGRHRRVIANTGRPNGLALDKNSFVWVAESANSALLRMTLDGKTEVIAMECEGKAFLWSNDLCFGPDGALYLTDSGITLRDYKVGTKPRPDYEKVKLDGRVYRIDCETRQVQQLDSGLRFANGLAFGPDGNLYVSETRNGMVYRYLWRGEGRLGPRECFGQSNPAPHSGLSGTGWYGFQRACSNQVANSKCQ